MVKKIHYCWFGSELPDSVKRNIEHWAKLNPDYELCEWNESNIDFSNYDFAKRAIEARKWGFLADVVRLQKLITDGGWYIDADVELITPFSSLAAEKEKLIMGYMYDCALGTAVMYSPPAHPYLTDILSSYQYIKPNIWPVNNTIFTAYFINQVEDFYLNGKRWENDLCQIYEKTIFEQPAFIKNRGVSIHHCCGSWKKAFNHGFDLSIQAHALKHMLKWASRLRRTWLSARNNEFTECYLAAKAKKKQAFDISGIYDTPTPYQ